MPHQAQSLFTTLLLGVLGSILGSIVFEIIPVDSEGLRQLMGSVIERPPIPVVVPVPWTPREISVVADEECAGQARLREVKNLAALAEYFGVASARIQHQNPCASRPGRSASCLLVLEVRAAKRFDYNRFSGAGVSAHFFDDQGFQKGLSTPNITYESPEARLWPQPATWRLGESGQICISLDGDYGQATWIDLVMWES